MIYRNLFVLLLMILMVIPTAAQQEIEADATEAYIGQTVDVGAYKTFSLSESTASIDIIGQETLNRRSAKSAGWDIVGQGLGVFSREVPGVYGYSSATFSIRGVQSLDNNAILKLVDGFERDFNEITPEEVESVTILKDAAAVALYGQLGANGVILVTTKRGKFNSREVKVTFDHMYGYLANKPKFVDAYTYASATNEALGYEGSSAQYSDDELTAYKKGTFPYSFPNVDWVSETFRNHDISNKYVVEFTGGGERFRYYNMINLLTNKGFVKNPRANEGYSTQDMYVRANMRINLDIDLTSTTQLKLNFSGSLDEQRLPGDEADLWGMIYTIPALAYPVKNENDTWGGSSSWDGLDNPVANAEGAGYFKYHTRQLMADMTLKQDLSAITPGLGFVARFAVDHASTLYEDHSKTYAYGMNSLTLSNGVATASSWYTDGSEGELSDDSGSSSYDRSFVFDGGITYDRAFGKHDVYGQARWQYMFEEDENTNSTVYRQNVSLWAHYGYDKRYLVDLALVGTGSSKLAPGTKWAFSPNVSLAWVVSNEDFLKGNKWLNFLKVRASVGVINRDVLPDGDTEWLYYEQGYVSGGSYYYNSSYGGSKSMYVNRMASENPSHEKAIKQNFGIDAQLFKGLNVTFEAWMQQRKGIWVDTSGYYSDVVGMNAPYENLGRVDSHGVELKLDYHKILGKVSFNVGASFAYHKTKIKEQAEEPRLYDNLVQTGNRVDQYYGLRAIGLYTAEQIENMNLDESDPEYEPVPSFGNVFAGDIRYEDVNGDGIINSNDYVAIGHTSSPEISFSFNLGAEWKGLGIYALFSGATRYSGKVNTAGLYQPRLNASQLSQYYYDNRWTESNPDAKFPRLCTYSNRTHNYQTSSWWIKDRSFLKLRSLEIYYNLPKQLLAKTMFVNHAKIYVRGIDLFSLDHIPVGQAEGYGDAQPLTRSLAMGLQVTF